MKNALAVLLTFVCLARWSSGAEPVDYLTQIKPILSERCFACHGALKQEAGLRLDAAVLLTKGGESGPVLLVGKPDQSLLIERVSSKDVDQRMPPEGKPLADEQVNLLRAWIDQGARAPETEPIPRDPREHWAYQSVQPPAIPSESAGWIRNDVDRFIVAKHKQKGLVAVGAAPRSILLRRVYLDLIGLPPSRDELQRFLADEAPDAYERAVDRLLNSPRYGERWARHWMDVWRYSDPSGYGKEIRDGRMHIWRWRDWIVDSLNADKGYDRMIVEMLAADEAAPADVEALRATGFLARNWYKFNRNLWLDNIVEHSSKAFLGITANCARCHDHKYDPIAQREYYQLRAVFETHDVRDEPYPSGTEMMVRAFDAKIATPTYPFIQGDERRPDKEQPVTPGVPLALGSRLQVEQVELSVAAYYPALRSGSQLAATAAAAKSVETAQAALASARRAITRAQNSLDKFVALQSNIDAVAAKGPLAPPESNGKQPAAKSEPTGNVVLADDFTVLDEKRWTVESGNWIAIKGRLAQDHGDNTQYRLVSKIDHPENFRAKLKLRITSGATYRSVGLGFDGHAKAMNAVYLSQGGAKVQVTLQNAAGSWAYPPSGARSHPIKLGQDYELEVSVRDRLLNVAVDGSPLVAFTLPAGRKAGRISLWTFSAQATFDAIRVEELPKDAVLVSKIDGTAAQQSTTKVQPKTRAEFEASVAAAAAEAEIAQLHLEWAQANHASLNDRYAAERAKFGLSPGDVKKLASAASRSSRQAAVCKIVEQVARNRQKLAAAEAKPAGDAKAKAAVVAAQKALAAATKQLASAEAKLAVDSSAYQPLGVTYPKTSSGRRLAFARWIADRQNPLTARVAVNHIWMRHFDAPLVERTFDFGLRSERPEHAELLDWLAAQFMEDRWSMKRLHKLIVTSGVYRLSCSSARAAKTNRQIDPDNHFWWRANPRRMEAEVVRDGLLHVGGSLDLTMGGPPIDHNQGQTVLRRSLYFRQDKERQMTFLSLFDGAKVNECYRRKSTVAPQQALAMYNSRIAASQANKLAADLPRDSNEAFIAALFEQTLCRLPRPEEQTECEAFLAEFPDGAMARQQLALVLLNHNDFVTIR